MKPQSALMGFHGTNAEESGQAIGFLTGLSQRSMRLPVATTRENGWPAFQASSVYPCVFTENWQGLSFPTFSSFSSFLFNWKVWNPELQFVRVSHSSCPNPLHRESPWWQEELLQHSGLLCKSPLNRTPSGRSLFIGFSSLLLLIKNLTFFFFFIAFGGRIHGLSCLGLPCFVPM